MEPGSAIALASGSTSEISSRLYLAAAMGNFEPFKKNNDNQQQYYRLELLMTPINNYSILHIYTTYPSQTVKSIEFVEQVLDKSPSLLLQANAKGDTPLHLAAKFGHSAIVEVLIQRAKSQHDENVESGLGAGEAVKLQMLRMKNNDGNTALHYAMRSNYIDLVEILIREDPDYPYSANNSGETPLFIAAECGRSSMVAKILETCESVAHEGPEGKTALHGAVKSFSLETTRVILKKKKSLTKGTDQNGWTPLHYAAYCGHPLIVEELLKVNDSVVCIADTIRKMTPLHLAASQGSINKMKAIISRRPDCCELVDVKGWTFLHYAMVTLSVKELNDFFKISSYESLIRDLIKEKDIGGNTPLHVLAACRPNSFLLIADTYPLLFKWMTKIVHRRFAVNYIELEARTVMDTYYFGSPKLQQEVEELKVVANRPYQNGIIRSHQSRCRQQIIAKMEKGKDAQLVVAALIATVTFTVAFTMPGGFHQEGPKQGTAILDKNAAFQVFIITDALAMAFSLLTVFLHYYLSCFDDIVITESTFIYSSIISYVSNVLALGAMVVAFVTGTYAVLSPSLWLVGVISFIGLSLFILCYALVFKASSSIGEFRS